jgi:hypothetical protein
LAKDLVDAELGQTIISRLGMELGTVLHWSGNKLGTSLRIYSDVDDIDVCFLFVCWIRSMQHQSAQYHFFDQFTATVD